MKKTEFAYDYRNYIAEKRKKAYEKLEKLIGSIRKEQLMIERFFMSMPGGFYTNTETDYSKLKRFYSAIDEMIGTSSLWFTNGLR